MNVSEPGTHRSSLDSMNAKATVQESYSLERFLERWLKVIEFAFSAMRH